MLFGNRAKACGTSRDDQIVTLPLLDEALYVSHRLGIGLVVSYGKVYDGLTENSADTGLGGFVRYRVFEVVHVAVGCGTTANHLRQAQTSAGAHKVFGNVLRFGGKDILRQPILQIEVVCQSTKQNHGDMSMPIDEARNNCPVGGIDRLTSGVFPAF